ncbi:MAG: hypothetical protein OXN16_11625 [Gammaproteobacteria bacterium]|nr:hypothetical protein [Gammaproteobacteria bacterium]
MRKRIVHGLLERRLGTFDVIAFMDHQTSDELKPPMQHPVVIALPDRTGITLVFQYVCRRRAHIESSSPCKEAR